MSQQKMQQVETAETAAEAFARYQTAYEGDGLVQGNWHSTAADGRLLACGLGVLGADVSSPADCPAKIMPRWLAQMVVSFFDNQDFLAAKAWGLDFYAELKRLNGAVPFSVVHDWQANVVAPLGFDWRNKRGVSIEAETTLQALHIRALNGDLAPRTEWFEALRLALRESYAYANAYADADADAYAYAYADANADAYAYANAYANADAYADANADAYAYANADADAYAYANADADAYANADADAKKTSRQGAWARLANGMVECLRRVPAEGAA